MRGPGPYKGPKWPFLAVFDSFHYFGLLLDPFWAPRKVNSQDFSVFLGWSRSKLAKNTKIIRFRRYLDNSPPCWPPNFQIFNVAYPPSVHHCELGQIQNTNRLTFIFVPNWTKHKTAFVFCTNTKVNTFVFCIVCICTYESLGENHLIYVFSTVFSGKN